MPSRRIQGKRGTLGSEIAMIGFGGEDNFSYVGCHAISRSKRAEIVKMKCTYLWIYMYGNDDISVIYFRIHVPFISRVRDRNIFGYYYYPVSHTQYCLHMYVVRLQLQHTGSW